MITFYFGSVGSGKTTVAVRNIKKALQSKRYSNVYSNIGDTLSKPLYCPALADFKPPSRSLLVIDESGIEFNSRDYAKFKKGFIEFFKKHRHEKIDIQFFSQSWEDTDKIIRDLATEYWRVINLGLFSVCRRYDKIIPPPNEKTQYQIITGFKKPSIFWQLLPFQPKQFKFVFRMPYYKYFNSFSPIPRPVLEDMSEDNYKKVLKQLYN